MTRTPLLLIAPLAVAVSLGCLSLEASTRGDSGAIAKSILVTVLDEAGDPLRDLEPREFTVSEDGTPREIISARPNDEPLFVALLVDTARPYPGVEFPTLEMRRGLEAFNRKVLGSTLGSQVAILDIAMGGSVVVQSTADIKKLNAWTNRIVASQQSTGVLLEALSDASKQLGKRLSPRRAIVSVTFDSAESSSIPPQIVAEEVLRSGAAFWPISIRHAGRTAVSIPRRETLFATLPDPTGGMRSTALSTTALEAILARVAAALTSQYEVTYYRPAGINPREIQAGALRGSRVLRASWIR